MPRIIDLNCDMGEGFGPWSMGDDVAMLDLVSSANIACGFHASDPAIMRHTVREAARRRVGIGAHPGFDDLQGFGRRRVTGLTAAEIEELVVYQVGALMGIAALEGATVTHLKVHGALSNMACEDRMIAMAVASAARVFGPALHYVVLPNTEMERAGEKLGLRLVREVFADRAYLDDLSLMPRNRLGAVLHDPAEIAARVLHMARDGTVTTVSGAELSVPVDTICVHGDTPGAVAITRAIRRELDAAGIEVAPFADGPRSGGAASGPIDVERRVPAPN
jgi:UPF0271 protein